MEITISFSPPLPFSAYPTLISLSRSPLPLGQFKKTLCVCTNYFVILYNVQKTRHLFNLLKYHGHLFVLSLFPLSTIIFSFFFPWFSFYCFALFFIIFVKCIATTNHSFDTFLLATTTFQIEIQAGANLLKLFTLRASIQAGNLGALIKGQCMVGTFYSIMPT